MKLTRILCSLATVFTAASALAQETWTNFIRQVQIDDGVQWDVQVAPAGERLSPLAINPGGARFELWTVRNMTLGEYLLESKLVATYIPQAYVSIRSEDPYGPIPRTRADRPFVVDLTINGLLTSDPTAPAASKTVKFQRHAQSYGEDGTGENLNRSLATLVSEGAVSLNGSWPLLYTVSAVPGTDRAKLRGEERFTVMSLPDYQSPASQLAAHTVQIWPVADGAIEGITQNQFVRFALPKTTLRTHDLYPNSRTFAQVYQGNAALGTVGQIVPGSVVIINDTVPHDRVVTLSDWDSAIRGDGRWTLELLTETPFGVDRLAYVSFDLDRTIEVNGSVTTLE